MRPRVMAAFSTRERGICPGPALRIGTSRSAMGAAKGARSSDRCLIASSPGVYKKEQCFSRTEKAESGPFALPQRSMADDARSFGHCLITS